MLRQECRNVRQEGVIHRFIRGIAIRWLAPQGDSTIDTQRGEDAWLQVGALVLAIAIGHPKRYLLLLGLLWGRILPVHRDRGRIKVDVALVEAKNAIGPDGTG